MVPGTTLPETTRSVRRLHGYQPAPLRATRHRLRREPLSFGTAPMLLAAGGFSLGIIDAHWVWHPPLLCLVSAFLAAGLTFLAARIAVRTLWLPLLLLWFSAGQFCAFVAPMPPTSPTLAATCRWLAAQRERDSDRDPLRREQRRDSAPSEGPRKQSRRSRLICRWTMWRTSTPITIGKRRS